MRRRNICPAGENTLLEPTSAAAARAARRRTRRTSVMFTCLSFVVPLRFSSKSPSHLVGGKSPFCFPPKVGFRVGLKRDPSA